VVCSRTGFQLRNVGTLGLGFGHIPIIPAVENCRKSNRSSRADSGAKSFRDGAVPHSVPPAGTEGRYSGHANGNIYLPARASEARGAAFSIPRAHGIPKSTHPAFLASVARRRQAITPPVAQKINLRANSTSRGPNSVPLAEDRQLVVWQALRSAAPVTGLRMLA
jgi:hypothetical protein